MVDVAAAVLGLAGLALLVAPGLAAAWALAPRLDGPKSVVVGVVAGFSLTTAAVFVLGAAFAVPFTRATVAAVALALTACFAAWGVFVRRRARRRVSPSS